VRVFELFELFAVENQRTTSGLADLARPHATAGAASGRVRAPTARI